MAGTTCSASSDSDPSRPADRIDLPSLEEQCYSFLTHGLAPSTRRTYASAQSKFISFCRQLGKLHPSGSPCPTDECTLCLFVTFLARTLQHSSIKVYLSGIRALHIDQGFPDPLAECLRLQRVVRGIKRCQGTPSSSRLPITDDLMLVIWRSLDVGLDWTDPFRKGCFVHIGLGRHPLCAVQAMMLYLASRGDTPGPLFLFTNGQPLTRTGLTDWLRRIMAANQIPGTFSSHSFRIGAATVAARNGVPDHLIQTMGRWSSNAYQLYIRTPADTLAALSQKLASLPPTA